MASSLGITVDPELVVERQQSMSCYVVTKQVDEAAVALLAVQDRLFLVDGDGHEYPNQEALDDALGRSNETGHWIYTPNAVSEPVTRDDGAFIWLDTKGDTSAEMASTMVKIIVDELRNCGVTAAHLRPITEADFRAEEDDTPRIGSHDSEGGPPPEHTVDPRRLEVEALFRSTGVPFERMSGGGGWLARWPNAQLPAVVVSLHDTECEARAGFEHDVSIARAAASPRCSYEVMRVGRVVIRLEVDSWNKAADQWLERVRDVFSHADAVEKVVMREQGNPRSN